MKLTKAQERAQRLGLGTLADDLRKIGEARGISYQAASFGRRRYDPDTGEPYWREPEPARLTLYGERAEIVYRLLENASILSGMLEAAINEKTTGLSAPAEQEKAG